MDIRVVLGLISAVALSGCAGAGADAGGWPLVMHPEPKTPVPESCTTSGARAPAIKVVNINFQPDPMIAAPASICARPGDVLWFKFNGNPNADLKVESKDGSVDWLQGGGKQQWFYVLIPWDLEAEEELVFLYNVILGDKVLDPEVRVKNNYN
jgi:hypothetical protein